MKTFLAKLSFLLMAGIGTAAMPPISLTDAKPAVAPLKASLPHLSLPSGTDAKQAAAPASNKMDSQAAGFNYAANKAQNTTAALSAKKTSKTKRMFRYKGRLYIDTGERSTAARCGVMDGKITKTCPSNKTPAKELQSNFGKYGFQFSSRENRLEVCIDDTWTIFAYHENDLDGVSMKVAKNTANAAKLTVTNKSDSDIIFSDDYSLEKLDKKTNEWNFVPYIISNYGFHDIGYAAKQNTPVSWNVNWKSLHGSLKPGTYRISKRFLVTEETGEYTAHTLMAKFKVSK